MGVVFIPGILFAISTVVAWLVIGRAFRAMAEYSGSHPGLLARECLKVLMAFAVAVVMLAFFVFGLMAAA